MNQYFKNDGFTILETVIVILLAGLFLGLALGAFTAVNRHNLHAAANIIAQDIRLAQQLNMSDDDAVFTLLFDLENDRYFIHKGIRLYKKVSLPAGVDLVATNFDFDNNSGNGCDNKLRFNKRGEPYRTNGILCGGHLSLRDSNGNFLYVIVASITGRVRIDTKPPPG